MKSPLITAKQLKELRSTHKVIILDTTIDKVAEKIDDSNKHIIPDSLFFDIEGTFSDSSSGLPHTMVNKQIFTAQVQQLGIDNDSLVIIYDRWGVYSSPRAWWMFQYMGHKETYVLDGGIIAWQQAGYAVTSKHSTAQKRGNFAASVQMEWFKNTTDILNTLHSESVAIIDARGAGRFNATVPEPRPGVRPGHIPSSSNLPFDQVLDGAFMKDKVALQALFKPHLHQGQSCIFTCGSGITASILALAAYQIGCKHPAVYDGSWAEWGADPSLPIE